MQIIQVRSDEYSFRYDKIHKSLSVIKSIDSLLDIKKDSSDHTKFSLAMPDKYKLKDPIESYRRYYIGDKFSIATWKVRNEPYWWNEDF